MVYMLDVDKVLTFPFYYLHNHTTHNIKHFNGWLKLSKYEVFYRGLNMSFDFSVLFNWANLTMDATAHYKQSLHFKVDLISTLNSYNKSFHTYQRTIWWFSD